MENAFFGADDHPSFERSPADVLRLVVFAVLSVLLFALTMWAEESITGLESDIVRLFDFVSPATERILAGLTQILAATVGIVILGALIWTRRWRALGYVVAANVVALLLVGGLRWWLEDHLAVVQNAIAVRAGVDGNLFPDVTGLAQLVAAFVVMGPFVTRRWRRAGHLFVPLLVLLELLVAKHLPADIFLGLAVGATTGAAVLLAFGRPNPQPSLASVAAALGRVGLPLAALKPASVDARGSTPYFATLDDGTRVFAKVLGADERAADLLFRIYRYLRFKNLGDERPFSSLRRTVEHEALVSLQARDVGVRTPRMRAVGAVGSDSLLLAYDMIDGDSLDRVDDDAVDDAMLHGIWEQVALLRKHRIAHRDLRRANLFVDAEQQPWVIDFGFSEVAASDALLAADLAQLLVALAIKVGVERSVASAIDVLGADVVATSLPRLQLTALSGATQEALKEHPGQLAELQAKVSELAHVDKPVFEQLHRVSGKTLFTMAMIVAVMYFLIPQLTDMPGIVTQVRGADWAWLPWLVIASAVTYVGAAISMAGSVPARLRIVPTFISQVASSFASKLAPSAVGGMALNVRVLQKQGVDPVVAGSSVGLNAVGGFVMHVILMLLFFVWAGRSAFGAFQLPSPHVLLYGLAGVVGVGAIAFAVPAVRTAVFEKLVPLLRRSVGGVAEVVKRPGKLGMLFGGSLIVTTSYIVCVYFSIQAFGGGLDFAQVGAVYLAGAALATAAPTPGGLGAVEAALIAGFVAAGLPNTVAVPAVFLFRLATFWFPILPGWLGFTWLRREEYI